MTPRLLVVPLWVPWAYVIVLAAMETHRVVDTLHRVEVAESALDEARKQLATVNEVLFRCEAGHARIADRIQKLEEAW